MPRLSISPHGRWGGSERSQPVDTRESKEGGRVWGWNLDLFDKRYFCRTACVGNGYHILLLLPNILLWIYDGPSTRNALFNA